MGKILIVLGLLIVAIGVLIQIGLPLGRLPGDIVVRRGSNTLYFPIVTCFLVSVVLTILGALFRRWL